MVAIAFSAFFKNALQVLNELVCVTIKLVYCHLAPSKLQFISINCKILLHFNNKGAVTKIDLKRRTQLAKLVHAWPLEEDSCLSLKLMVHKLVHFTLSPTVGPKMSVYSALGMVAVLVEVTTSSYTKTNRLKIQTKTWQYYSTSWNPNPKGLPATCGQILDQQFFSSPFPSFLAKQDRRLSHFLLAQLYKQHMSFSDCLLIYSNQEQTKWSFG